MPAVHDELGWSYPAGKASACCHEYRLSCHASHFPPTRSISWAFSVWAGAANISGNPRVFKRYQDYIKQNSGLTTPQAFGAGSWDKVVPITFANITGDEKNVQALRVRVYW